MEGYTGPEHFFRQSKLAITETQRQASVNVTGLERVRVRRKTHNNIEIGTKIS